MNLKNQKRGVINQNHGAFDFLLYIFLLSIGMLLSNR